MANGGRKLTSVFLAGERAVHRTVRSEGKDGDLSFWRRLCKVITEQERIIPNCDPISHRLFLERGGDWWRKKGKNGPTPPASAAGVCSSGRSMTSSTSPATLVQEPCAQTVMVVAGSDLTVSVSLLPMSHKAWRSAMITERTIRNHCRQRPRGMRKIDDVFFVLVVVCFDGFAC
jgi:hypothetical protein